MIPHYRITDEALVANERTYAAFAHTTLLSGTFSLRYFLSDDYYAGIVPIPFKGRELYLPQYGLGRLIESPADISLTINTFLNDPQIEPQNALVTGYDFLIDQANAITNSLQTQGITQVTQLINNQWVGDDLRTELISQTQQFDLISLNSHFTHFYLYPNEPHPTPANNNVFALEMFASQNEFSNSLIFSVGCHSGLNVPDGDVGTNLGILAGDWAQVFASQGATFIGNTGFGYGDSDLVAYSEQLMVNFVDELNYTGADGVSTVGRSLMRAKQRYYNSTAASSFSNYDEKVLAEMTLYGLPMLAVQMPNPSTEPPGTQATLTATTPITLDFGGYTANATSDGVYYTISGADPTRQANDNLALNESDDIYITGARPVLPRAVFDVSDEDTIAKGVLMLGGTFTEVVNADPIISRILTDSLYGLAESSFPLPYWFPNHTVNVNRLLNVDDGLRQRLVVIPAQFRTKAIADDGVSTGLMRLYDTMQVQLYRTDNDTDTDFVEPIIWKVSMLTATNASTMSFQVQARDRDSGIQRVVILYRSTSAYEWQKAELEPLGSSRFGATVPAIEGPVQFFAQVVDGAGNIALGFDRGNPYQKTVHVADTPPTIYLPIVLK
jgi:hypothetical protein